MKIGKYKLLCKKSVKKYIDNRTTIVSCTNTDHSVYTKKSPIISDRGFCVRWLLVEEKDYSSSSNFTPRSARIFSVRAAGTAE